MNCPLLSEETADVLLDYAAGRLDPVTNANIGKHIAGCKACAGFQMGQVELWTALDRWEPEPVSMGFNGELWRKLEEAAAAPWYRKLADALRLGAWKPAFPLAAAMAVVVAGFLLDHRATPPANSGAPGIPVTEVDQVEKTLDDIQLLKQFDLAASQQPM